MSEMKTFVFTDVVSSVKLKSQMPGRSDAERDHAYVQSILTPHRNLIEQGLHECGGRVVSTAGDGHFLVFPNTIQAATWAIDVQTAHCDQSISTPEGDQVRVRMSLHVGFPQSDPNDPDNFIGRVVDYAARLNDYATGGQLLISAAALGLLKDAGLEGVRFHTHGDLDLKGIGSVEVYELLYDEHGPREIRNSPKAKHRSWSVLPQTMGLTEYAQQGDSKAATSISPARPARKKRRLGNYELEELLGAGGMGDVYKARHVQFDRTRAVKVIKPHFLESGSESIIKRFYREIKAVGALDHPNVVVAVDSSAPDDETHYLVMEYLSGVSTDVIVKREGPLAPADACELIRQAAVGLDYISAKGMVHRDIKPSNLMLTMVRPGAASLASSTQQLEPDPEPVVKILDLGLALLGDADQPRLTQMDHGAMGTAMYMSPEQWRTTSVDIRSDIYSLGCSLFHLLTGSPPFYDSDLKPEKAHERLAPPSVKGIPGVPKQLDAVLRKMLAKHPDQRYTTPAEVAEALAPFAEGADLKTIIEKHEATQEEKTAGDSHDETRPDGVRVHDTQPSQRKAVRAWSSTYVSHVPAWRRWANTIGTIAAITAIVGLSFLVVNRGGNEGRADMLTNLAVFAKANLKSDIENRFDALTSAASDSKLVDAMLALQDSTEDDWSSIQSRIERYKLSNDERNPATSWFITNEKGLQIARAPRKSTIGDTYWHRTYFHGEEQDLPEDAGEIPAPIDGPHLSTAYWSDGDGRLKVAFSVPIKSQESRPKDRKTLGVLGMSIELGHFELTKVSENLSSPLQLAIVDMRHGEFEARSRRVALEGLVLHNPDLERFNDAFHLPEDTYSAIKKEVDRGRVNEGQLARGYHDLLGQSDKLFWCGYCPLKVPSQNDSEAKWLVLIQEPMQ